MTDVYNTGKGFAFVTFDRMEDAETVSYLCLVIKTFRQCTN